MQYFFNSVTFCILIDENILRDMNSCLCVASDNLNAEKNNVNDTCSVPSLCNNIIVLGMFYV